MNTKVRKLVTSAVVGACYAALTMALAPISYGAIQLRLSEVICILPFFMPWTAWGLFLGCALANVISAAGILDVVFGSLATLLACLCMAALGRPGAVKIEPVPQNDEKPPLFRAVAACFMPVLFNGLIIGAMLAWVLAPRAGFWAAFLLFGAQVAAGEAAVMLLVGLPLMLWLPKRPFFTRLLCSYK